MVFWDGHHSLNPQTLTALIPLPPWGNWLQCNPNSSRITQQWPLRCEEKPCHWRSQRILKIQEGQDNITLLVTWNKELSTSPPPERNTVAEGIEEKWAWVNGFSAYQWQILPRCQFSAARQNGTGQEWALLVALDIWASTQSFWDSSCLWYELGKWHRVLVGVSSPFQPVSGRQISNHELTIATAEMASIITHCRPSPGPRNQWSSSQIKTSGFLVSFFESH